MAEQQPQVRPPTRFPALVSSSRRPVSLSLSSLALARVRAALSFPRAPFLSRARPFFPARAALSRPFFPARLLFPSLVRPLLFPSVMASILAT